MILFLAPDILRRIGMSRVLSYLSLLNHTKKTMFTNKEKVAEIEQQLSQVI